MSMNLNRYERLGVDLERDIALGPRLNLLQVALEGAIDPVLYWTSLISDREQVALAYYLLDDLALAREHASKLVDEVEDYLYGEWRDGYTVERSVPAGRGKWERIKLLLGREGCRRELTWMREFRAGLLWSLCLPREEALARIIQFPAEDLSDEADLEGDFGPAERALFVVIARLLRGEAADALDGAATLVERGRKKKPKLMLRALSAIHRGDADGCRAAIHQCVCHHIKAELPNPGLDSKQDLDASILYHVARRLIPRFELDAVDTLHIVMPSDQG